MITGRSSAKIIIVLLLILAVGFFVWHRRMSMQTRAPELKSGFLLPASAAIVPFELKGTATNLFDNSSLNGHWSLLFFGFTHCPVVCPTTLATLKKTYQDLQVAGDLSLPQVVFISVDPERDTPDVIAHYLKNFSPKFVGATGTQKQLKILTHQLGIAYSKIAQVGTKNYMITHSANIVIVNPKGQWVGIFSPPFDDKQLSQDFQTVQRFYQRTTV